ncbi:MAG: hypothetical protein AABN33_03475 [Acidobacteriota bacterium]
MPEDKKELQIADNPRFIEGIYNYCDRWCERCSFTARCMLYAMEEEDRDDPAAHDINSEAFWEKLASIFKETHEMIATMAAEQGIDLESIDLEPAREEENRHRAKSESNPLSQSAEGYAKLVNEWFDREYPESEQERDDDPTRSDLPLVDFEAQDRASNIHDAVEVIRWYQFQIAVKIMRALLQDDREEADEPEAARQRDSDGSAKVALIGIERSISAWGKLRELVPEKNGSILPMMVHLEQLRRGTEQAFPKASSFVRPGFDEAPDQFVS